MGNADHKEDLQAHATHAQGSVVTEGKGCVTKCVGSAFKNDHGSYRKNGYNTTKNDEEKRKVYIPVLNQALSFGSDLVAEQQFGVKLGVIKNPEDYRKDPKAWDFDRGPRGRNYKSTNRPFVHMYHHMVPWEVLSETFDLMELRLFQSVGYNLNEGINMIILPCNERPALILGLFTHPYDHPAYTTSLISMLDNLKDELKPKDEKHLTKPQVGNLKDTLMNWETNEWKKIVDAGKTANAKNIGKYKPSAISSANTPGTQ